MAKHKARLNDFPPYVFIYEYTDEAIEFHGVVRFGIHKNGTHSIQTLTDSETVEYQVRTGWKHLIVKPDPLLPAHKRGRRVRRLYG